MNHPRRPRLLPCLLLSLALWPAAAHSFCGFYVARGDAKLFNRASQVVLVRDGDRTVMTMANDFKGAPREFAIVIPVPNVLQRKQIHVGDQAHVDHLDAFSAPRLVEYFDPDPCEAKRYKAEALLGMSSDRSEIRVLRGGRANGVRIEARYTVGEYDILILSAEQSHGLAAWLMKNGYRIPKGAERVLESYIKQGMKFFVAKVNLKEQSKLGFQSLRPIQVAYESPRFMLPIRLGTVNAEAEQELFVYALTRQGRVETVNYRAVKLPSDVDIPVFVKGEFAAFYRALFAHQVAKDKMTAVYTEHAWDMGWCDPCASEPLTPEELRGLGVWWVDEGGPSTFVTRLHVRYDRAHFPQDLVFQQTADRSNFQARYVLRHEWTGKGDCSDARQYRASLKERREREARTLAALTGWEVAAIRSKMGLGAGWMKPGETLQTVNWWERIWGD